MLIGRNVRIYVLTYEDPNEEFSADPKYLCSYICEFYKL